VHEEQIRTFVGEVILAALRAKGEVFDFYFNISLN